MTVEIKQIQKLATMSRLEFTEERLAKFADQFQNVVAFVDKISALDTKGVPPINATLGESTPERADKVAEPAGEAAVKARDAHQTNAPKAEMGFYVVPKIVE
jgi:aspartyl-tRNA(Asn)/glutamyl-tRNA(Gln) amidotransferase subunit C